MNLTPWTKRFALVCLATCITTAIICRESHIAAFLAGGMLTIINPEKKNG